MARGLEPDDLSGPFQPLPFYDSKTIERDLSMTSASCLCAPGCIPSGPMGLHMHPGAQRQLADVIERSRSIVFERSWELGEVPEAWRKANVTSVCKKGKKEDPVNYRPVSFTSVPGKVIEQLNLDTISRHMKDKKVIGSSQHGFAKG